MFNSAYINKVADTIENGIEGLEFDMVKFWENYDKRTTADIAGFVAAMEMGDIDSIDHHFPFEGFARDKMGLTPDQSEDLFFPVVQSGTGMTYRASAEEAVWTLRHLAETGNVVWKGIQV